MSLILTGLRAWYGVAGRVAPGPVGRQAARLFLTPMPRRPPSRWSEGLPTPAHDTITFGGEPLDVWTWAPDRPSVLLVHGWGGHGEMFTSFVPALLAAGLGVVAFDGPAHGRSRARQTNILEFTRFLDALVASRPQIAAAIGHSFGASCLTFAVGQGLPVGRVALIAPFARSDNNIAKFADALSLPPPLRASTREALLGIFRDNLEGWDLSSYAARLGHPALILHDEEDRETEFAEGRDIAAAWPSARFVATRGLGHRRILKDEAVIRDVVEFIGG